MVLCTSYDAGPIQSSHDMTNGIGSISCQSRCQQHHMTQKSHVVYHFGCLKLKSAMVSLMMILLA